MWTAVVSILYTAAQTRPLLVVALYLSAACWQSSKLPFGCLLQHPLVLQDKCNQQGCAVLPHHQALECSQQQLPLYGNDIYQAKSNGTAPIGALQRGALVLFPPTSPWALHPSMYLADKHTTSLEKM